MNGLSVCGGRDSILAKITARIAVLFISCSLPACDNGIGTRQGYEPQQPIEYSHALHAGDLKLDCQYCHFGAERSRHAGVPPVSVCMNCHSQVLKESPEIQKLARAVETKTPIEWTRVHRLPDFVYFNHSRHVPFLKCQTCHGPVQTMPRVHQVETMTMGWCLDCHRSIQVSELPTPVGTEPRRLSPPTDCAACHQ